MQPKSSRHPYSQIVTFHSRLPAFQQPYVCAYFSLLLCSLKMYKPCIKITSYLSESLPSFLSFPPCVPSSSTLKRLSLLSPYSSLSCSACCLALGTRALVLASEKAYSELSSLDLPTTHRLVDLVCPPERQQLGYFEVNILIPVHYPDGGELRGVDSCPEVLQIPAFTTHHACLIRI